MTDETTGPELVVHLDECLCPDGGHGEEGDTIPLRPQLDYTAVRAIRYAGNITRSDDAESSIASLMAVMSEGFLLHGVESWTLREGKKPIEPDKAAIRKYLLGNVEAAMIVGDYADAVYQRQVLHPLVGLARRLSQPSQMNGSTSPQNGSAFKSPSATDETSGSNGKSSSRSEKRPKRSKYSSITSTPTASTEPTTPASAGASTS